MDSNFLMTETGIFLMLVFWETVQDIKRERWVLTEEGKIYATAGSPEVQLFLAIPPEGITQEELQVMDITFLLFCSLRVPWKVCFVWN